VDFLAQSSSPCPPIFPTNPRPWMRLLAGASPIRCKDQGSPKERRPRNHRARRARAGPSAPRPCQMVGKQNLRWRRPPVKSVAHGRIRVALFAGRSASPVSRPTGPWRCGRSVEEDRSGSREPPQTTGWHSCALPAGPTASASFHHCCSAPAWSIRPRLRGRIIALPSHGRIGLTPREPSFLWSRYLMSWWERKCLALVECQALKAQAVAARFLRPWRIWPERCPTPTGIWGTPPAWQRLPGLASVQTDRTAEAVQAQPMGSSSATAGGIVGKPLRARQPDHRGANGHLGASMKPERRARNWPSVA